MKKILALIFHPVLMLALALLVVAVVIWKIGPLVSIGEHTPLTSEDARYATIGGIVLLVVAQRLFAAWRAHRKEAALTGAMRGEPPAPVAVPLPEDGNIAKLRARFDEALEVLRDAHLHASGTKPGWRAWLSLSSRRYLYQLPWYLFIGAPGSGKTTALVHSGLHFPLAHRFGTEPIGGLGGTRNCDWWFTDDAVLIDTAGRFTTHESDSEADRAAWHGFLDLLRTTRPRQPINGVLVTVSVQDLLNGTPGEFAAYAAAVRARLRELGEQFRTSLPIYVFVTKTDLLAGFMEFFADLGEAERTQAFGFTLPYETPLSNQSDSFESRVSQELDALEARLAARVPQRMHAESRVPQRAAIFGFPQQFSALKPLVVAFLRATFPQSKHSESQIVRGVYFTSGTQEGTPIDRVMGTIARAFGIEREVRATHGGSARSFFIERVLREVVFAEQGLAGSNLQWARRRHLRRVAALAALAVACAGMVSLWGVSYLRNRAYVAEVQQAANAARSRVASANSANADLVTLLPLLSAVQALASTPDVAADSPPLGMQWGLWQGRKLEAGADTAYHRLLEQLFAPRLATRIEEQARNANAANPGYAYEALKAYLMVHDPERQNKTGLKAWILADWKTTLQRGVDVNERNALAAHLDTLLALGPLRSNVPIDNGLVASLRTMLTSKPLAERVYGRLVQQGVGDPYPAFTVAAAGGPNAALVFTRASGAPLTQGVPGLYTYNGYQEGFAKAIGPVARQLAEEQGWVLGIRETAAPAIDAQTRDRAAAQGTAQGIAQSVTQAGEERLEQDVRVLYLQDYARTWSAFLDDVRLIQPASLTQAVEIARILSSSESSPLVMFTRAASHETTLASKPSTNPSFADRAQNQVASMANQFDRLLRGPDPTKIHPVVPGTDIESIVDDRFAALRALVTSPGAGQPAPIDQTVSLINDVYVYLNATDAAIQMKATPPPPDALARLRAAVGRVPAPVQAALEDLDTASARQTQVAQRTNLSDNLVQSVSSFCKQATLGRYPFDRNAPADVPLKDFGDLFAPGGKFDDFFQKNLAAVVDVSIKPWAFKKADQSQTEVSPAGLVQFEHAAAIRDTFFQAGGKLPAVVLQFKPVEMDPTILRFVLDIDGQEVSYAHGPDIPTTVQWPGAHPNPRVSLQLKPPPADPANNLAFDGPWALFRLFDRFEIEPTPQPERFFVTFDVEGRKVRFEVTANSVENPFRLTAMREFACPDQL